MTLNPQGSLGAIIVAAGESKRLGHPKQLIKLDGESLISRICILALNTGCSPVIIVIGAYSDKVAQHIPTDPKIRVVKNHDWKKGMGNSIAAGFRALISISPDARASLILTVDQPKIKHKLLKELIEGHTEGYNVVSRYNDSYGPPVIIDKSYFNHLETLDGPIGAKTILGQFPDKLRYVEANEAAFDIDKPEDLSGLNASTPKS